MAFAWVSLLTLIIGGVAARADGSFLSLVSDAIMAIAALAVAIILALFVTLHPYKN
jgi:spore maturation protein SpmA